MKLNVKYQQSLCVYYKDWVTIHWNNLEIVYYAYIIKVEDLSVSVILILFFVLSQTCMELYKNPFIYA